MSHEYIDSAKRINFEKLSNLVAERIYVLQEYVKAADRNDQTHDAVCRDLVMPCIGLLDALY
jgi:hypothetical protein